MSTDGRETLVERGSLLRRLSLLALGWGVILLTVGAISLTAVFRQTVLTDLDSRQASITEFLLIQLEATPDGGVVLTRDLLDPRFGQVFSGRYWQVIDADAPLDAEPVERSRSLWDETIIISERLRTAAVAANGQPVAGNASGPDGQPLRLAVRAVVLPAREDPVIIIAAEDRRPSDRRVWTFGMAAAGLLAGFAVLLAVGVVVQVRVGLSPVLKLRRAVAQVRDGETQKISGQYPSEMMPLATELNALIDHSREVVERARTHVGNLAHALKTPITVLSNEARGDESRLGDLVRCQTATMTGQVEHHLRRARAAANAKAIGARTPAGEVVNDLGRTLRRIYARREVELDWQIDGEPVFRGERQDLEDLVGNLMDNACKWARSRVEVRVGTDDHAGVILSVDDDGPGLDPEARARVLGRGVRLDEQAPGTGFGLSIVSDLAKAYGGSFVLEESPLGGLGARLVLPGVAKTGETRH
ncbi:MAG: sensor histidine kinase [Caulobacterales bacterium]|uniref:sensor histidine kinase n=1 Tax=Glycocaulis sp. TaxID=1969725 RepID=UPI003F9F5AFB